MSSTPQGQQQGPPRPRQVTLAASLVMAASVMLVLSVFEQLSDLRSIENREAIEGFLSEPPGSSLGLGTESVLTIVRTLAMVAAGLATAAAILGWHVLKRNRSAQIALTVVAVPLFLSGLFTGGFLASVVLASVTMLWLEPARHWFAGTTPETRPTPAQPRPDQTPSLPTTGSPTPPPETRPLPPGPPASEQPPPWTPYAGPSPWGAPVAHQPAPGAPGPATRARRPLPVTVACAIAWVCCGLTAMLSLMVVAALLADAPGLFAEMQRRNPDLAEQGVSDSTIESLTWTLGVGCLVWALVSGVLAVLAFNRIRWAGIGLVVSAGAVALLCLAGSVVSPPLAVPGVLAAATAVLLLQPASQRWLARREASRPTT
jgi:hypothetical protein